MLDAITRAENAAGTAESDIGNVRNRLAAAVGSQTEDEILPGMNDEEKVREMDPVILLDQYAAWTEAVDERVAPAMRKTDECAMMLARALREERQVFESNRYVEKLGPISLFCL